MQSRNRGRGRFWTPFPHPGDQGQLEAFGLGPEQGRADRTTGQMMGLTFAVRGKPENTLLLQRWALPGPCYIKEQDHSVQGDFAEPCIPALCYRRGVQKRPSAAALRLSGVTSLAPSTGTSQEASVTPGSGRLEPGSGPSGDMWEADTWVERVPCTMQISGTQCRLTESDSKTWFSEAPWRPLRSSSHGAGQRP